MKAVSTPTRILISTGIYPPAIGGPALYAKSLSEEFKRAGHKVEVKTFGRIESVLPTGFRHLFFFFKIIPSVLKSELVIALDTFSVGLPTVFASRLLGKKIIIRTGGDFLWEGYVERTGEKVLLRNFYENTRDRWNLKERAIYKLTEVTLQQASAIVFSTKWQQEIFNKAYSLGETCQFIVENFYGTRLEKPTIDNKNFIGSTRPLKWKNLDVLARVFNRIGNEYPSVTLLTKTLHHDSFVDTIKQSYAVIIVSLGDISPNTILDSIRVGTPFILTKENGLMERIRDIGIFVDPLNEKDIEDKIRWLLKPDNYKEMQDKLMAFNFTHAWSEIADEFLSIFGSLKR